jgi:hypothetical protein
MCRREILPEGVVLGMQRMFLTQNNPVSAANTEQMSGYYCVSCGRKYCKNCLEKMAPTHANGGKGITQTPQGNFPLPETQVKPMLENILRDPIYICQNLDKYQVQYVGDKKFADLDTIDLLISGPVTCHYLIDKKSFQIIGCQYQGMSQSGPAAMEDIYFDFRSVDGILISFKTITKANGRAAAEMNMKEIKLNVAISEADFKTE